MNYHAVELEKLLAARGVSVLKLPSGQWQIKRGDSRSLKYSPDTGRIVMPNSEERFGRRALRGSPATIAEILADLVKTC
jgi:hypothetical protein